MSKSSLVHFVLATWLSFAAYSQTPEATRQSQPAPQQPARPQVNYNELFGMPATHNYRYFEEMVPAGDSYKLLTRIYLPEGEGPWPVVVTRTPYVFGAAGDNIADGREYAKRGIGYVQQYCRGKGGSEGFYQPNIYEREDGIALYKWLDGQEWCGTVGIFGSSYTALTGWIVGDKLPAAVKGMYLVHYGVDRHISIYSAGMFRHDILSGWTIDNAAEDIKKPVRLPEQKPGEAYYDFYKFIPHVEADVNILGVKLDYYRDWITHTDYNDPYWNEGVWADLKNVPPLINIPLTIVAGQFDHHEEGTLLGYERLNPDIKAKSRLILGSWNHSSQVTPTHVPALHAREFNAQSDQFKWFYELLVSGKEPEGEIMVYVIEEDRWVNLEEWPVKPLTEMKYYLTSSKDPNGDYFMLSGIPGSDKGEISYWYDPLNPVIAVGGETMFTSSGNRGSLLQPEPGYRDDVISFLTKPLTEDAVIAGKVKVILNVSSDADDTEFVFTLSEVRPDGSAYNIRTAVTTLAYRNAPMGNRQTYAPGEIVEISLESSPIVWNVKKGNALRLDIKSSNFPEYSIHTNYSGVWATQGKTRIAKQTIYTGGDFESFISLPLTDIR